MSHDAHEFFDFDEQEPPRRSRAGGWRIVLVVLAGVVVALIFAIASLLSFDKAGRLADWAGNSMVVSGTYQTMTHDLVTKDYNGIYAGIMPDNELLEDHPFDNGLNDPTQVKVGACVLLVALIVGLGWYLFVSDRRLTLETEESTEVRLRLTRSGGGAGTLMRLDDSLRVTPSPALFGDLKQLLGPACLV